MKTNHRRGYVAKTHRDQAMFNASSYSTLSDKVISASIENDFTNGNRGMAKAKRGAKKFIRSRTRFHEKVETKRLGE